MNLRNFDSSNGLLDALSPSEMPKLGNKKAGKNNRPFFNGTFVQFGLPGLHKITERGVRSILWVNGATELW